MSIVVVGAGTMGAGIAQVCLEVGETVTIVDASSAACDAARASIASGLARSAARRASSQPNPTGRGDSAESFEVENVLHRLHVEARGIGTTADPAASAMADATVVIEAVSEDRTVKQAVWRAIGAAASPSALLGSNTSSLSIDDIATWSGRPTDVCGIHFFNPAPVLPLVEVVRGERTSEEVVARAATWARHLGKTPIVCRDRPGFIVNRLLIPYVNEAARLLDEGWSEANAIDEAMVKGARMPLGPLALADLIGLDVVLAVMETLHDELGDPRYAPAHVLRRHVRAGKLGRKSGVGFHEYGGTP